MAQHERRAEAVAVGDCMEFIATYVCTRINLYDALVGSRDHRVEEISPRRRSTEMGLFYARSTDPGAAPVSSRPRITNSPSTST